MKFFNTAGPCNPEDHYMLPATQRLEAFNLPRLIQQKGYFIVHAPRQTGKTTAMLALAQDLTASGDYISVLLSLEVGVPFSHTPAEAEDAVVSSWKQVIRAHLPSEFHPPEWFLAAKGGSLIGTFLSEWAFAASRPLVIFLDEIDALQDEALLSVLRQLRAGYTQRPKGFPASIALIGLRDVRDYQMKSGGSERLNTSSPFNIAVRALSIRNFTAPEVTALLDQHTQETGQVFQPDTSNLIYNLTQGQPWLVNALAKLCVEELEEDLTQAIQPTHVLEAKETLILRRQTHLESLADKLRESRLQHVIEPLLSGDAPDDVPRDDIDYALDLGLVKQSQGSNLQIANVIYKEIIPRELASVPQSFLPSIQPTWLNPDNTLNLNKLLQAFLAFWRQHGQPLLKSTPYHEVAAQLVMMAFLHRVVNGHGTIDREYALGSGRIDLHLRYGQVVLGLEMKVWRDGRKDPLAEGLQQLDDYLSGLGLKTGWLVIFDQRSGLPDISERLQVETVSSPAQRQITVLRA